MGALCPTERYLSVLPRLCPQNQQELPSLDLVNRPTHPSPAEGWGTGLGNSVCKTFVCSPFSAGDTELPKLPSVSALSAGLFAFPADSRARGRGIPTCSQLTRGLYWAARGERERERAWDLRQAGASAGRKLKRTGAVIRPVWLAGAESCDGPRSGARQ